MPAVITQILDDASGEVTHLIIRLDPDSGKVAARNDLIPPNEHLQCALIEMAINQTFEPHIHPSRVSQPQTLNTQEAWIVLTGQIEATLFDVFGKVVATSVLREGDLCITLRGGHNYKSLTSGSIVYEFKTGPYLGPEIDKVPVSAITPREG